MSACTVLIVEDNADIRETLRDVLELSGYAVATASHGGEACTRLAAGAPGLIVLDLMMPVMDGWQFLEHLRADPDPATAATPVVVVSGVVDSIDSERLQHGHACEVLAKPVDIDALLRVVAARCRPA